MRAKMQVISVKQSETQLDLTMMAVGGGKVESGYPTTGEDEDNTYARWTPTADLTMAIQNPDLFGRFHEGQKFYVDFTPAIEHGQD